MLRFESEDPSEESGGRFQVERIARSNSLVDLLSHSHPEPISYFLHSPTIHIPSAYLYLASS
jgi:hypothetical protein